MKAKVRDVIAEVATLVNRRKGHVDALTRIDLRIAVLVLSMAEATQTPGAANAPVAANGPIPHAKEIKLALIERPLPARRIARRIDEPEESVRRSLRLLATAGTVEQLGAARGRSVRWQLVGRVAGARA